MKVCCPRQADLDQEGGLKAHPPLRQPSARALSNPIRNRHGLVGVAVGCMGIWGIATAALGHWPPLASVQAAQGDHGVPPRVGDLLKAKLVSAGTSCHTRPATHVAQAIKHRPAVKARATATRCWV